METTLNYINKLYGAILSMAVIWGGWYFAKSAKLKKADEDNEFVGVMDRMIPVIDRIQSPLMADLERLNAKLDILSNDYIKIQIEVGILKGDLTRKEREIEYKDNEIKLLRARIKELEAL
jgi:peptidoglycan hydrolase CwlO-like protein